MSDVEVFHNERGRVIGIIINGTRYSPEALMMTHINLEEHKRAVTLWKEAAAEAYAKHEEERAKRLEAETKLEQYAARVADAEQAMAVMIDDLLKRGDTAEAIGKVMRAARDLINLNTTEARERLERNLRAYDELRKGKSDERPRSMATGA